MDMLNGRLNKIEAKLRLLEEERKTLNGAGRYN